MNAQTENFLSTYVVDSVNEHFKLPFQPWPFQADAINNLAPLKRSGWYAEPGCGKTLMCTIASLYQRLQTPGMVTLVIMPPILLDQWYKWMRGIGGVGKVVLYRGTPAERRAMPVKTADVILMSIQVFKRDWVQLYKDLGKRPKCGIIDEATSIKNAFSDNHKKVRDFFTGETLMLLTGTPLSNPGDVYAYVKLIAPHVYTTRKQFLNIHVEEEDYFGNIRKWRNLELLKTNLMLNSCRMLKEEVLINLKEPVYAPINYALSKEHQVLYKRLMDEQLLELQDGRNIDATSATRLYHAAQQIVCNLEHFSGGDDRSIAYDLLDEVISELGMDQGSGKKLLVFAQYKMTNRRLVEYLKPYGAVACFSEVSAANQARNINSFMSDPKCQVLVAQPLSAGYGLNLQEVCNDVLFLETPVVPANFHQAVARVYREGQKYTPVVRIGIAQGTIQELLHTRLLEKDELVNQIQIGFKDLKDAIYGS